MEGINSLNNCNQSDFNKRIDKILGLSEIQYFAEFKNKNYLLYQDDPKKVLA